MYRKFVKRFFDIVISGTGLVILAPVLLPIVVLLVFANRGTPFFIQPRPGINGRKFSIIKFKTMNNKNDGSGNLLPDTQRIHKVGGWIRSLSIDELPQIINVLKGDMSIIGPRPLLPQYIPYYTAEQARRHKVRPGMTGWAQINGRNAISWEQKFEYDVWYVDNISLGLDLKIMWLTFRKIITREGINASTDSTMQPFDVYCRQSDPNTV